jgi:cytochrome b pre-mRNA-processing protein 3
LPKHGARGPKTAELKDLVAVFAFLERSKLRQRKVDDLYQRIVDQARRPQFYADWQVPDTLDGRFEMIVLHAALVLDRLRNQGPDAKQFAQKLFDTMLADFDSGLRIAGVGDLRVAGKLKQMAKAFYGRAITYTESLGRQDGALAAAISRNVYGTIDTEPPERFLQALDGYVRAVAARLAEQTVEGLCNGTVLFPDPPAVKDGP